MNPEKTTALMLGIAYPIQKKDIDRVYRRMPLVAAAVWAEVLEGRK